MPGRPKRRARLAEAGELAPVERRHGDGCGCRRCVGLNGAEDGRPFEPGNEIAVTHGAYVSLQRLATDERVLADVEQIRATMEPYWDSAYEPVVELLAIVRERVRRAQAALEQVDGLNDNPVAPYLAGDRDALATLRGDLRGWIREARALAASLGLDPLSRSRLGVNVARIRESPVLEMQRRVRELEAS